jgi:hypothetical protein
MTLLQRPVALAFLVAWCGSASAQTVTFASKYPKTGPVASTILVKGKVNDLGGWKIEKVVAQAWQTGKDVYVLNLAFDKDGNWGENQVGCGSPGVNVNVVVDVYLSLNGVPRTQPIRTANVPTKTKSQ